VRKHVSNARLINRHLLYDVENAVGTLERCNRVSMLRNRQSISRAQRTAQGTLLC